MSDTPYHYPDGSLKWGHPIDVGHLILQLQTLDPAMKVSSVTHIPTEGKPSRARAFELSMSRERWDELGWLDFSLPGPECLALWASVNPELEQQVESLRAELADEKERADSNFASCERIKRKWEATCAQLAAEKQRADALEADKERLDWLEKLLPRLPLFDHDFKTDKYWWMIPGEGTLHSTLREAIDAARKPVPQEPKA